MEIVSANETTAHLGISSSLLVHYNDCYEVLLAADSSPYGVGTVLSHWMPDSTEQPVAYVLRLLSPAEHHHSQLDKEALLIMFTITKFGQYLLGCHFVVWSHQCPLAMCWSWTSQFRLWLQPVFIFGHYYWVPTTTVSAIDPAKFTPTPTLWVGFH